MKIAVIGSGIAGNTAAWALSQGPGASAREVTVYEKDPRIGGHAHTVDVDYDGTSIAVDMGFIVYNELNYPNMIALFDHLGVKTKPSDMSFAVSIDEGKREWKGADQMFQGLFARKRNALSPAFYGMLLEILRFNKRALADLDAGTLEGLSLGEYLAKNRFKGRFLTDYLIPMGAAIWSMPTDEMLRFPARSFVQFFRNHKLLHFDRPVWRTVDGGSREYVKRIIQPYAERIRVGVGATRIERSAGGVMVTDTTGHTERFDEVILACHSDQALGLLADASAEERAVLGAIRYKDNKVYLHRDETLMPKRKAAWAAWNFLSWPTDDDDARRVSVSYSMNLLQGIPERHPLFVSLNPPRAPRADKTFVHFVTGHPQYDQAAIDAQKRLPTIQGVNRTWFAGAWANYGFHEDGLAAGLIVAEGLGAVVPWRAPLVTPRDGYRVAAE
jgi:hypothetical protein